MRNIQKYWKDVREKAAELAEAYPAGELYLVSIDNPDRGSRAGAVTAASINLAAQCIVNRTHDIASKDAIKAYLKADMLQRSEIERKQDKQRTIYVTSDQPRQRRGAPKEPANDGDSENSGE